LKAGRCPCASEWLGSRRAGQAGGGENWPKVRPLLLSCAWKRRSGNGARRDSAGERVAQALKRRRTRCCRSFGRCRKRKTTTRMLRRIGSRSDPGMQERDYLRRSWRTELGQREVDALKVAAQARLGELARRRANGGRREESAALVKSAARQSIRLTRRWKKGAPSGSGLA